MAMKNSTYRWFTTLQLYEAVVKNVEELSNIKESDKHVLRYLYTLHKIIGNKTKLYKTENYNGCKIHKGFHALALGLDHQNTANHIRNLIEWGLIFKSAKEIPKKRSAAYKLTTQYDSEQFLIFDLSESNSEVLKSVKSEIDEKEFEDDFTLKTKDILSKYVKINKKGFDYLNDKYFNPKKNDFDGFFSESDYYEVMNEFNNNVNNNNIYTSTNQLNNNGINNYINNNNNISSSSNQLNQLIPKDGRVDKNFGKKLDYKRLKMSFGKTTHPRDIPLMMIYEQIFYCSRPIPNSRVYNNFTNLPRDHRRFVKFRNKPILMTDISNSQILLGVPQIIATYYDSNPEASELPTDIIQFKELCESGQFYEALPPEHLKSSLRDPETRKFLKTKVFQEIWFNKLSKTSKKIVRRFFVKKFPTVFEMIKTIKKTNHKDFANYLQVFEAKIMVDEVASEMLKKGSIVLTLHDAIICSNQKDLAMAEKLITKAFAKYSITPSFKRENGLKEEKIENISQSQEPAKTTSLKISEKVLNRKPIEKRIYQQFDWKEIKKEFDAMIKSSS